MMTGKLFVFYSLSGNVRLIAEKMSERGYNTREIRLKKEMPKRFFFQIMRGGFEAGMHKKPALLDFDASLEGYEEIVFGTPVWNGQIASPLNTALSLLDLEGKKVSFILSAGGGEAPKAVKWLNARYPDAEVKVIGTPASHPEELEKI